MTPIERMEALAEEMAKHDVHFAPSFVTRWLPELRAIIAELGEFEEAHRPPRFTPEEKEAMEYGRECCDILGDHGAIPAERGDRYLKAAAALRKMLEEAKP